MSTIHQVWGTQEQAIAYIRGANGRIYRHKRFPVVAVIRERESGRFIYAVWCGKAGKPSAYFSAASFDSAQKGAEYYFNRYAENCAAKAKRLAEQAAKRAGLKASDHWTVGDVVYNSWGYEQTNVDWYQVTGVDARSIRLRPIAAKAKDTAYMSGICQPDRYNFTGPEFRKTLNADGHFGFRHGGASKWDGRPVNYSYYH